jgi:processive 1,2-diacylglycerol beta-glucosyltransferase
MTHTKKKLLIVYATAGSGHKKAAEALLKAAQLHDDTVVAKADIVDFMPAWFKKIYSDGYIFLITHLPSLWGFFYFLSDAPGFSLINVYLRRFLDGLVCRRFLRYLLKERPDIVIATQFLASEITALAKIKYGLKTRLVTIVTDFGVHNFWINPGTDFYCVASSMTRDILLKKKIAPERIAVTGIPLDSKFLHVDDRSSIRRQYALDPKKFTVLIATGGIGIGPIEKIAELLRDNAQLLVVCGTNKILQRTLERRRWPDVRIFGFIDFMEKLMSAADVMVTKAGGLSVTESLAMGVPMVFFSLIPGQETINARTLSAAEAGVIAANPHEIRTHVLAFQNDGDRLAHFATEAGRLARPNACPDILAHAFAE